MSWTTIAVIYLLLAHFLSGSPSGKIRALEAELAELKRLLASKLGLRFPPRR